MDGWGRLFNDSAVTAHVAQLQLKETLRKGIGSVAIGNIAMAL